MEKDERSPPAVVTPSASACGDGPPAEDLSSDVLRSRLLQLYLARVMVPKAGGHDPDECNSMRVEDDDSDYADRRASFDDDDDEQPGGAAADEGDEGDEEEDEDEDGDGEEEEEEDADSVSARISKAPRFSRLLNMRRASLQLPLFRAGGDEEAAEEPLGSTRPSPRTLEARRLAHFLEAPRGRRVPLAPATPDGARATAWRMESELRQTLGRRGSLQTDDSLFRAPFGRLARRNSANNLEVAQHLPANLARARSEVDFAAPAPPQPPQPQQGREMEMKRRELNALAPVSF